MNVEFPYRIPAGMAVENGIGTGTGTGTEVLAWSPGIALRSPSGLEAKLGSLVLLLLLPLACGLAPLCCFRQPPSSAGMAGEGRGTGGSRCPGKGAGGGLRDLVCLGGEGWGELEGARSVPAVWGVLEELGGAEGLGGSRRSWGGSRSLGGPGDAGGVLGSLGVSEVWRVLEGLGGPRESGGAWGCPVGSRGLRGSQGSGTGWGRACHLGLG